MAKAVRYFDGERFLPLAFFKGEAATLRIGEIKTGDPGTDVIIENVGDKHDAILNITIPRGKNGAGLPDAEGAPNSAYCLDEQGVSVWRDILTGEDAVAMLTELGFVDPLIDENSFYDEVI